ncbi:dipeptidase [Paenibacillus hamazuiensis]|uniref:dipeptidase n=1 Tax=Paenibacillus hamazuiensis TaxID=2936508 RepID=UPI003083F203
MPTIIDAHCDALMKMFVNRKLDFYQDEPDLDVNYERMAEAGVKVQFFALFLPEALERPGFEHLLEYIDIFYRKVQRKGMVSLIKNQSDLRTVFTKERHGAILSLEGVDVLAGNEMYARIVYQLGVRFAGITWNYANWAADGVMEPRKGGFTLRGKKFIKECNDLGIILDVSHLSVKGFWELAELSQKPFIASHSNALAVCPHPRNLNDEQIKAIIKADGTIGITFVPYFVRSEGPARITDILRHIDHVCSLGGADHLGFGSDFDGIKEWVHGLEHAGRYGNLVDELCKHYKASEIEAFLWGNWYRFLEKNLPE